MTDADQNDQYEPARALLAVLAEDWTYRVLARTYRVHPTFLHHLVKRNRGWTGEKGQKVLRLLGYGVTVNRVGHPTTPEGAKERA